MTGIHDHEAQPALHRKVKLLIDASRSPRGALAAVVDLHRPFYFAPGSDTLICHECMAREDYETWPCATYELIAEKLGA